MTGVANTVPTNLRHDLEGDRTMPTTTTDGDDVGLQEAWLILAQDVLDTVSAVLGGLSPQAQAEITDLLQQRRPGYDSCVDLADRARSASENINPEN